MAGTFSAEKSKDDLVNQLKRGEIDEDELAIRQREIDDLVKTVQLMSDKKSMVDRMKKSKEYEGDAPVFALQCRFAFANFSEAQLVNGQRTGNMRRVAEVVSDALVTAVDKIELRLPTLEEVRAVEEQLIINEQLRPVAQHAMHALQALNSSNTKARWHGLPSTPMAGAFFAQDNEYSDLDPEEELDKEVAGEKGLKDLIVKQERFEPATVDGGVH
eukprot:g25574.t2